LTLSSSNEANKDIISAPQPETVRKYSILYQPENGREWAVLADVDGNHQRLRRHDFPAVTTRRLRVLIQGTNGYPKVRIFEVRCYA
jgi:hypothetical protein